MQLGFFKREGYNLATKKGKFLSEMEKAIPWTELEKIIRPLYQKQSLVGRPKYELSLMLRITFLQLWYNLSDGDMEDEIEDSSAFQTFLSINPETNDIPDETTILNFRHFLEKNNLQEKLFERVNRMLEEKGLIIKRGTITDATILKASSSTKNQEKKRDCEMSSTKKNNNYHFGMKIHTGVDSDSGLIHTIEGSTAKVTDSEMFEGLLHGLEKAVFGDKGYWGDIRKRTFRDKGIFYGILDKAKPRKKLSSNQKKRNKKLSSIRAKVEHPFNVIKRLWGHSKTRFKGIEKNLKQWKLLAMLSNLYKVRHQLA